MHHNINCCPRPMATPWQHPYPMALYMLNSRLHAIHGSSSHKEVGCWSLAAPYACHGTSRHFMASHAIPMHPMPSHAIPCNPHAIPMPSPCHPHAIPMPSPCYPMEVHVISMEEHGIPISALDSHLLDEECSDSRKPSSPNLRAVDMIKIQTAIRG